MSNIRCATPSIATRRHAPRRDRASASMGCIFSATATPAPRSAHPDRAPPDEPAAVRLVSDADPALQLEIERRRKSAVRAKVVKYDQLHAMSKWTPPLVEVRRCELSASSVIYERVRSFEIAPVHHTHPSSSSPDWLRLDKK